MTDPSGEPTVSVVIPTYNYGRYVARAVDSVLAQTRPPRDVVVVDDGSTDDTHEVLARFGDRIHVIRQQNCGVSQARNNGAAASEGDLIAFLDADDFWHEDKLACQVEAYRGRPDAGMVHCGLQEVDVDGNPLGPKLDGLDGWVAKDLLLLQRTVILAAPSNAIIPRAVFDEAGGFDPALSTAADWDLCFRIAVGRPFVYVPELLVSYTLHSSNMHRNIDAMDRDMHLAFRKAFASDAGGSLRHLRRNAYANLYVVLSGSYFGVGNTARAVRAGARGCLLRPQAAARLAWGPVRAVFRQRTSAR